MNISFDSFDNLESPVIYLCNPHSVAVEGVPNNVIGIIPETRELSGEYNLVAKSQISFVVDRPCIPDSSLNRFALEIYTAIKNRRLIFLSDIGYFVISNVVQQEGDSGYSKQVTALSVEHEMSGRATPAISNGAYNLHTDDMSGIIDICLATMPNWTLGHIDTALLSVQRHFDPEEIETNIYDFLMSSVANAFECLVIYDISSRTVSFYEQASYNVGTSIYLSLGDVVDSIEISEDADDIYTAMRVSGYDNLDIAAVNPLGTSVIYNFDYYLPWMSDGLRSAVQTWKATYNECLTSYYNHNLAYYTAYADFNTATLDIQKLETQRRVYVQCRENAVAEGISIGLEAYNKALELSGGTALVEQESVDALVEEIDTRISLVDSAIAVRLSDKNTSFSQMNISEAEVSAIRASVAFDNCFTQEQMTELAAYITEGEYSDENVGADADMTLVNRFEQEKVLFDRAVVVLGRVSKPKSEFTINANSALFAKRFLPVAEQIAVGCTVSVETLDRGVLDLVISAFTVGYDNKDIQLTIGGIYDKFDTKSLYQDLFGSVSKSANDISYIKDVISPIEKGEIGLLQKQIEAARTLTKIRALSSENEEVIIDDTGYTGRQVRSNGEYEPEQLKINHNTIVFTEDAFDTASTAIGKIVLPGSSETAYGINAEVLLGTLISGERLSIGITFDGATNELGSVLTSLNDGIESASEYRQYLAFTPETGLVIGAVGDAVKSRQTNAKYSFLLNGREICYLDGRDGRLYVNSAETHDRLSIGSADYGGFFDAIITDTGLGIKWRATE